VVVTDADRRAVSWNTNALRILELSAAGLAGAESGIVADVTATITLREELLGFAEDDLEPAERLPRWQELHLDGARPPAYRRPATSGTAQPVLGTARRPHLRAVPRHVA